MLPSDFPFEKYSAGHPSLEFFVVDVVEHGGNQPFVAFPARNPDAIPRTYNAREYPRVSQPWHIILGKVNFRIPRQEARGQRGGARDRDRRMYSRHSFVRPNGIFVRSIGS